MFSYELIIVSVPAYLWKSGYCVTTLGTKVTVGCHSTPQQGCITPQQLYLKLTSVAVFCINVEGKLSLEPFFCFYSHRRYISKQ